MPGPRIFSATPLQSQAALSLDPKAARHIQVLRMQPGQSVVLFDGEGGQFDATISQMHKAGVDVHVGEHDALEREASVTVELAVGMPANERMDWLVEKATELGVARIIPLLTERTVLRFNETRAAKRREHWQAVAIAACEQCGRNRVPSIEPIQSFQTWLSQSRAEAHSPSRVVLSFDGPELAERLTSEPSTNAWCFLSGPEGGLSPAELKQAVQAGFVTARLGPRVLRAETAALAALTCATYLTGY